MAINSDTNIHLALLQLGKNANRYRLDSTAHHIKLLSGILVIKIVSQQMMN